MCRTWMALIMATPPGRHVIAYQWSAASLMTSGVINIELTADKTYYFEFGFEVLGLSSLMGPPFLERDVSVLPQASAVQVPLLAAQSPVAGRDYHFGTANPGLRLPPRKGCVICEFP